MNGTGPPGWPGDDAARDGAPLDISGDPTDPRLVAAERVILQLRTLLGAVVAQVGDDVLVTADELSDRRARTVRIVSGRDGVQLRLPPAVDPDGAPEPSADPERGPGNDPDVDQGTNQDPDQDPDQDTGRGQTTREPAPSGSEDEPVRRAGDSALMRRLRDVVAQHAGHATDPPPQPAPGAQADDGPDPPSTTGETPTR